MLTCYIHVCNQCEEPNCETHKNFHLVGVKVSECPPKAMTEDEVLMGLGYTREEVLKDLKTEEVLQGWIESLSFNPQE